MHCISSSAEPMCITSFMQMHLMCVRIFAINSSKHFFIMNLFDLGMLLLSSIAIASLASGILRSNLNLQFRSLVIICTMTMGSRQKEPFAAVCAQERLAHRYVVREEMVYEAFGAIIPHLSSVILRALLPNPNFSSQPFESSTLGCITSW